MYTPQDINRLLEIYIQSPQGQADLKARGENVLSINGQSKESLLIIANELKADLINAYMSVIHNASITDVMYYFNSTNVKVVVSQNSASIIFDTNALYRPSLRVGNHFTGSGIRDIFSLITNGTDSTAVVKGEWLHAGIGKGIWTRGKMPRPARPFIQNVIEQYQQRYPYLMFTFPPEWN